MFEQHLYRRQLFNTMQKDDQLVDTVKLHLRQKIISKLKTSNNKKQQTPTDAQLIKKICCSLFLDYLSQNRLFHTASVFAPESNSTKSQFSKQQLMSLLKVSSDKQKQQSISILQAVINQLLPRGRLHERTTESYAQTDDRQNIQNLQNKLSNIQFEYKQKMMMGYKNVEETQQRFLKYKNQLNKRYKDQLDKQIDRIRNFEIANIRMEEQQRYKIKVKQYQQQLQISHKAKMEKLREREAEVVQRVTNKMKDIEKYNYDARQRILRDMQACKAKQQQLQHLRLKLQQKQKMLSTTIK